MANTKTSLAIQGDADSFGTFPKVVTKDNIVAIFGTDASESELAPCYPVGYNSTTDKYTAWMAPDPTILVVDTGGANGGTWGLTINGIALANTTFAHNATAALVKATIQAETGVIATVALATGVYTITFDGDPEVTVLPTVTGDVTQLTGGTEEAATATAGTASYGTHKVQGFVYPNPVQLDDTTTTQGVVMVEGEIAIEEATALVASGDRAALTAACKGQTLGNGIKVHFIANINKEI